MYIKRLLKSKKPGSAIPLVVLVVVLLSITGAGLLSLGLRGRIFSIRTASEITARCAADAGLTKAIFEMNEQLKIKPWNDSILPQETDEALPNCNAVFSYNVTIDGGGSYAIESVGQANQRERRANSTLRLKGLFEYAITTRGDLILKSLTLIDGYNSADSGDTDTEVQIATNSTLSDSIILNSGVTVDGAVLVGVGGDTEDVIKDLGSSTGLRYSMSEEIEFPAITPPTLPDMGNINEHGSTRTLGPGDNGEYGSITLKKSNNPGILEIDGGDVVLYITGDIDMGQSCEIVIKPGSSLTIYLDGDLDAGNSNGINNETQIPGDFRLYGTSTGAQDLDLKADSDFYGAVYAPNADIEIKAGGDIYGSFTGDDFEFKAGSNFHYDEALRTADFDDEGVRFVVERWSEQ